MVKLRQTSKPSEQYHLNDFSMELRNLLFEIMTSERGTFAVSDEVMRQAIEKGVLIRNSQIPAARVFYRADLGEETDGVIDQDG